MLVIRLFRVGKKNQPAFKIVVAEKRSKPRAGRFVEELGNWNPLTKEKVLKQERIKYWLSVGAKPSPSVYNLLIAEKIIEGNKIDVHKKPKAKEEKPAEAPAPTEEKPAEEAKPKEEEKPTEKPSKEDVSSDLPAEAKEAKAEALAKEEKPKEEDSKKETPKTE